MAIKNKDLIDVNKPFDEIVKGIESFLKSAKEANQFISNDLKKTMSDLGTSTSGTLVDKFEKAKTALANSNQEIKEASVLLKELQKIEKQYDTEKAKSIALETKEQKELIKLNEANKQRKKDLVDLVKYGKTHETSLKAQEVQLAKLRAEYKRGDAQTRAQTLPQIKQLSAEVNKLNANIGLNQSKVGSYFTSFTQGMKSMIGMYAGIQGIRMLFTNITGTMIDFEKAMSGVKAISGASGAEFAKLEENARSLGATTSKTAVEIAGLQKEYALLGFSTQEILDATEATILLSQATGEDLSKSAEVAGATIRGFGLNANETGRVVDVMAAGFTSSALNLERFSESMKYIAPIAKATGFSVEEVTANLAKLADAGIHGSMAGTSLRRVMLEMGKAGKVGADGLAEMAKQGITVADANDEVGARAATALLVLSEQKDGIDKLTESYNNASGAAKEMADVQMDNLAGSITLLSSAWDGLILKLTDGDGVIRRVVDSITSFVNWLTENGRVVGLVIKGLTALTAAWITYNIGLRLSRTLLGGVITKLWAQKAAQLATTIATKQATIAQKALNTAMKLNPIGLLISALAIALPMLIDFSDELENVKTEADKIIQDAKDRTANDILNGKEARKAHQDEMKELQEKVVYINKLTEAREALNHAEGNSLERAQQADAFKKEFGISAKDVDADKLAEYKEEKRLLDIRLTELMRIEVDYMKKDWQAKKAHALELKQLQVELTEKEKKEYIKRLQQDKAYALSILELNKANKTEILYVTNIFDEKILDAEKEYGILTQQEYNIKYNNLITRTRDYYSDLESEIKKGISRLNDIEEPEEDEYFTTGGGAIQELEQRRDLEISKLKLIKGSHEEQVKLEVKLGLQILEIQKKSGQLTQKEYETKVNDLKALLLEFKDGENPFGLTGQEMSDIQSSYQNLATGLDMIFTTMQEKWQKLITEFNTNISEQNQVLNRELQLKSQGLANTYDVEKTKLESLQDARDKAVQKERENSIKLLRVKEAQQAANLALAISNIFTKETQSKGAIGVGAAVIAAGVMLAEVASTESQIQSLKKYEKGGELEGESHAKGGIKLVNSQGIAFAEAEGGEYIINKKAYAESPVITNMINDRKLTDKDFFQSHRLQHTLKMAGMGENTSAIKGLTEALMSDKTGETSKYSFVRKGHNTIRTRK